MNAQTFIAADATETAICDANDWVRVATPVIKAYFALDDLDADLRAAEFDFRGHVPWNTPKGQEERAMDEARQILRDPVREMHEMIVSIRETAICDTYRDGPADADDVAGWDAAEEHNARVEREVVSVDAAIKLVGDAL